MLGFPKGMLGERSWKGCKEAFRRWGWADKAGARRARARLRLRPAALEGLEDRALMATAGADYVVTNFRWANPSRITYSIPPDGVQWISGTNAINSNFDARFGSAVWRREIARALATWQSVANINIVPTTDGAFMQNALGASQGDSRFGDIRIGGSAISNDKVTLAQAYYPPPQGSTAGGDLEVNLNIAYAVGADYDLFSVVLHETGHSLGLGHPTSSNVVMRAVYGGRINTLTAGDVAGIQAIYGARQADVYERQGLGVSPSVPIDLSGGLTTSQTATIPAASIDRNGEIQWFSFVAPSYASGAWQVTASASNSSMLSPKVTIYDETGAVLGHAADPGRWSVDATAAVGAITPGKRYFAAVTGATDDVFGIGAYNLTVSMSKAPTPAPTNPSIVPPVIPTPTPTPTQPSGPIYSAGAGISPDRYETNNSTSTATRLGRITQVDIPGLTLPTADVDFFSFQAGAAGVFRVSAPGAVIQVLNNRGRVVSQGTGAININASRNAALVVKVQAPGTGTIASYTLNIGYVPPVRRQPAPRPAARPLARAARQDAPPAPHPHAYLAYDRPEWVAELRTART